MSKQVEEDNSKIFVAFSEKLNFNCLYTERKHQAQIVEVQLFWEGHKNLELSSTCFDIYLVNQLICQNNWKITAKFCGLLRKAELKYMNGSIGQIV